MTGNAKRTAVAIHALHHLRSWTEHTTSLVVSYDELRNEVMGYEGKSMLQSMLNALGRRGVKYFIDTSLHWESTIRGFTYWARVHRLWMAEWNRILTFEIPTSWLGFMKQPCRTGTDEE